MGVNQLFTAELGTSLVRGRVWVWVWVRVSGQWSVVSVGWAIGVGVIE